MKQKNGGRRLHHFIDFIANKDPTFRLSILTIQAEEKFRWVFVFITIVFPPQYQNKYHGRIKAYCRFRKDGEFKSVPPRWDSGKTDF